MVATVKAFAAHSSATLALFKATFQPISDGIAAIGWVKTADTGQVDWSTVSLPAQGSVVYEIWRPNDALQATFPLFLKIFYGRFTATDKPWLGLQVGPASDGVGNLIPSGERVLGISSNMNGEIISMNASGYFAGDEGRLHVLLWPDVGVTTSHLAPCCFSIERGLNNSGGRTDEMWLVYLMTGNSAGVNGFEAHTNPARLPMLPRYQYLKPSLTGYPGTYLTSPIAGNNLHVSPLFAFLGEPKNPATGILAIEREHFGADNQGSAYTFRCSMYGVEHLYIGSSYNDLRGGGTFNPLPANLSHAVRWD
jgi:hypothetical protein